MHGVDRETLVARVADHYNHPRHRGRIQNPDVSAPGGNPGCGDRLTLHVRAEPGEERIAEASFEGEGCTLSIAAASLLLGRVNRDRASFQEVHDISYEEMIDLLGREVVGSRYRCATLALGTLKAAVRTIEMDRKLRAAGYSEQQIRDLRDGGMRRRADPPASTPP